MRKYDFPSEDLKKVSTPVYFKSSREGGLVLIHSIVIYSLFLLLFIISKDWKGLYVAVLVRRFIRAETDN